VSTLFMSPKGGNCTTVTTAAFALMSAARGINTVLFDLCGDIPATLGMVEPSSPGINDWLSENNEGDDESLVKMGTPLLNGLVVVHRGSKFVEGQPRWQQLAEAIRTLPHTSIIDAGITFVPEEVRQSVDSVTMVTRPCYLSLRRATHLPKPHNVIVIREEARALTVNDVSHVLGVPKFAEIPYNPAISRAVDAGLLTSRCEQLFADAFPAE
jgi:hypothetical protein